MTDYCLITFTSTHGAISAQKLLEPVCPVQVMPVLREISLGCGIALRFPPACLSPVRAALATGILKAGEYAFFGVTGSGANLKTEPIHS